MPGIRCLKTTVTVLPTLNHETQPDTNSKTVQAQHQNLEHRQTIVTGDLYQIVLWLQGVSLLLSVQHYHHQHQKHHFTDLQRIFPQSQITAANSYTLARFRQQGIVYCRVTTAQQLQRLTYIGSTKHTMTTRESTRNRKFTQFITQDSSSRTIIEMVAQAQMLPPVCSHHTQNQHFRPGPRSHRKHFHSATSVQAQFSIYYQSHERRLFRLYQGRQQQTQRLGSTLGQTPPRKITSFYPQLRGH